MRRRRTAALLLATLSVCATRSYSANITATWDGNIIGGNWTDAFRWSTNPVYPNNGQPGAGDTYTAIITAGNVGLDIDVTLNSFVHSGLNSSPNSNDIENFSTTTHTITTPLFDWSGGDIEGNVAIAATGSVNISGTNLKRMQVRNNGTTALIPVVTSSGTGTWSGAGVNSTVLSIGANVYYPTINNLAGATFDAQSDNFFNVQFNNAGTFTRTTGGGTCRFQLPFNNAGTVIVNSGGLELNTGGTSSGTFVVNASRRLFLYGAHSLSASSVVTGAGTVQFSNPSGQGSAGTCTIAGSYTPAATVIDGRLQFDAAAGSTGTLLINNTSGVATGGSGTLTVTGPTTYQFGNFTGNFTLVAQSGVNFAFNTNPRWNQNAVMNLAGGTSAWTGSFSFLEVMDNARVNVLSGATFSVSDGSGVRTIFSSAAPGAVSNAGTINKSGNGTLAIEIPAANSGTIAITAGSLAFAQGGTFTSTSRVNIGSASSTLRFGGAGTTSLYSALPGSSISGPGTLLLSSGTLNVGGSYNVGNTDLGTGIAVTSYMRATQGANTLLVTGALNVPGSSGNWTATLDLADNDLLINGAGPAAPSVATVFDQIKSARNGGTWDQRGITTSSAAANATTGLGMLSGQEYLSFRPSFDGVAVAPTDVVVKYTWNGDANLDGRVTFDDYVKIDTGFNTYLTGWLNGDFNYSGNVSFDDYVLIDIAFNQQNGTLSRAIDWISGDDRAQLGSNDAGLDLVVDHFEQLGLPYAQAFLNAIPETNGIVILQTVATFAIGRLRCRRHK